MVLVDTSIWIRAFANREPYAFETDKLLGRDEAAGHELVYGELLIGDRGGRRKFLANYEDIQRAQTIAHDEVVSFVQARKLNGRGVGWIDVHLLASAMVEKMLLWTADPRLEAVAEELGIAYQPRAS